MAIIGNNIRKLFYKFFQTFKNLFLFALIINLNFAFSQVINMPASGSTTTCSATFYDSGGSGGSYSNSENRTYTFVPATAGSKIRVVFTSFSTENNYDGLMIYNGPNTSSPLISSGLGSGSNSTTCPSGSFRGSTSPGTIVSTAADGSLTFVFKSDGSTTGTGWAANVSCVTACAGSPNGGTATASITSSCSGYPSTLSVDGSFSTSDVGITYQWQSAPAASGPWTNIAGATGLTYSLTVTTSKYYRRLVTCTASGLSDPSTSVYLEVIACSGYDMPNGQTITTCGALFYDSGGNGGNYGNNENRTMTFCSANGTHIRIDFTSFYTESGFDYLYVYDGPSTASTLIYQLSGQASGTDFPPIIISSGTCITLKFTSDGSTVKSGWAGIVSCTSENNTIARNFCGGAPHICNLDGYTGKTSSFYERNVPGNMCEGCSLFDGSLENNSWITFTATGTSAEFTVNVSNCSIGDGIQMGVYSGTNCNSFALVSNVDLTSGTTTYILQDNSTTTIHVPYGSAPPLVPGQTYYIMIDGYAGDVCDYSINAVSGMFIANINVTDTVICEGQSVNLVATGGNTYSWSNGASGSSITVSPTTSTTYAVTISGGNPLCPNAVTLASHVEVYANPTITISATDSTICSGQTVTLTASGGGSYLWSSGQNTPSITVSPTATTTYTVTATNGLVCTSTASLAITVSTPPVATITGPTSICPGDTVTLNATGGGTYSWSNSAITPSISVSPGGATTYIVTVTDASGCTSTASHNLGTGATLSPSITGATSVCQGSSVTITASGGSSYTWSSGQNTASITVTPGSQTTYTVTASNATGCTGTAQHTISVNPLPVVSITGPTSVCPGISANLTASGGSSYVWSTTDATASITVTPIAQTTYTVTATDGNGCTNSASHSINPAPNPTITITGQDTICEGGQATLSANGANSYVWSNAAVSSSINVNPIATTTYTVTGSNGGGCTSSASFVVTIEMKPILNLVSSGNESCGMGDAFINIGVSPAGNYQYLWTPSISTSNSVNNIHAGQYSIVATSILCTSDPLLVTITNTPGPNAQFNTMPDYITRIPDATYNIIDQSQNAVSWLWDFGDGNTSTYQNPTHTYENSGSYDIVLIVFDANNCSDTARKNVLVIDGLKIWIPNSFTGDNDGLNEVFRPVGSGFDPKKYEMRIYDRWGQCIFVSNVFENGWDGKVNGKRITDDMVFVYRISICDILGKESVFVGRVTKIGSKFR